MEQFFEFLANHPLLVSIFLACLVAYFLLETKNAAKKVEPQQLGLLTTSGESRIIDLRSQKEFNGGHITGSENMTLEAVKADLENLKAFNGNIVFVCKLGVTAGSAAKLVGGDNVYRLNGGINNWVGEKLPLVKTPATVKKSKPKAKKKK